MNATYDILQSIMRKPPVAEVEKVAKPRKTTSREDKTILALINKLSSEDLAKLLASK